MYNIQSLAKPKKGVPKEKKAKTIAKDGVYRSKLDKFTDEELRNLDPNQFNAACSLGTSSLEAKLDNFSAEELQTMNPSYFKVGVSDSTETSAYQAKMIDPQKDFMVKTVKNNKLSDGTNAMMENELLHADEAMKTGVYVNWTSYKKGQRNDCFRLGSQSVCCCGHSFGLHEKRISKKFSIKCKKCKCQRFRFMPQFPEEIGEYWLPYQKTFDYNKWKAKCKCKHQWNEHDFSKWGNCKKCGCGEFESNFACVSCNMFWQDHENTYETEEERKAAGLPVGKDFIPFAEMPDMHEALYNVKGRIQK